MFQQWFSRSWFARHWRGELNLGVSYWVNGFLAGFVVSAVSIGISTAITDYEPLSGFLGFLTLWSITFVVSVWQFVGIWHSAGNHVGQGGKPFWAVIAKFMVVIGMFQSYIVFQNNAVPQLSESFNILMGDDAIGETNFRLLNAGTELEVLGGITFGATAQLRKFLDAAPSVRTVHLNSHGGRMGEAIKMRDLIRERGLATVTNATCTSACTIAFIGGAKRYIHPHSTKMGFHQGSFPGFEASEFGQITREIKADAVRSGVSRGFMDKAYSTAATSMWYPTMQELLESNYVTNLSQNQFALSGFGAKPSKDAIISLLRRNPLFAAVEKISSKKFDTITDAYTEAVIRGIVERDILSSVHGIFSELVGQYMYRASDAALLEMTRVLIEEILTINEADPLVCHSFLFPSPGHFVDVRNYIDSDLAQRDLRAVTNTLLTAANRQAVSYSKKEVEPELEELFTQIAKRHGIGTVAKIEKIGGSEEVKQETCALSAAVYYGVMQMPEAKAIKLLRFLFDPKTVTVHSIPTDTESTIPVSQPSYTPSPPTPQSAPTHSASPRPAQSAADVQESLASSLTVPAEIEKTVRAWAQAWSSKNVGDYLTFYSDSFVPEKGINQIVWEDQRRKVLKSAGAIRVTLTDMKVTVLDVNQAEVTLTQDYWSKNYQDKGKKTLSLRKENGVWKIVRENSSASSITQEEKETGKQARKIKKSRMITPDKNSNPVAQKFKQDNPDDSFRTNNNIQDLSMLSKEENLSIESACSQDKYINGPAAYNSCLGKHLAKLTTKNRRPDLSMLSKEENLSIESACSQEKYINGPAAYNSCLGKHLAKLITKNRRPDLSMLSKEENLSIESACSQDKYINGPAAYNSCLGKHLAKLTTKNRRPDLSMLSKEENLSIESACSQDKYINGPAAYNTCLRNHLHPRR